MAYDPNLANHIRSLLAGRTGLRAKELFGGIAFVLNGNIGCGVLGDDLMVRVGRERCEVVLHEAHVRVFDTGGRPMSGWVMVEAAGLENDADLERCVHQGVAIAESLSPK